MTELNTLPVWQVLAQSSVGVSCAADTAENTLATIIVPAGRMGANGRIRITALWKMTNSANLKTMRHKFGGTSFHSQGLTTQAAYRAQAELGNRNSQSSQVGGILATGGWSTSTSDPVTSTVDTTVDATILITGTKASAGETLTLESYLVELLYTA